MSDSSLVKYIKSPIMLNKEDHALVAWPHTILCKQEFIYAVRPLQKGMHTHHSKK